MLAPACASTMPDAALEPKLGFGHIGCRDGERRGSQGKKLKA
jgi:hypothetical protein